MCYMGNISGHSFRVDLFDATENKISFLFSQVHHMQRNLMCFLIIITRRDCMCETIELTKKKIPLQVENTEKANNT